MDAARVKAQLRLTSQRLGQLQAKKDSEGQITRGDIATLLRDGNVSLARAKAAKLIKEDALGDVLEVLGMHLGVVLDHFHELERSTPPSPVMVEAASTIIFAAPHLDSKELHVVRDILAEALGPDFARSAVTNRDSYVSEKVVQALNIPNPSIADLDEFLSSIAKATGVKWTPELMPEQRVDALSELLDPSSPTPVVDMPRLRSLCVHGIPDHPPWLRPRIWRLLLGTLPVLRSSWGTEAKKHRNDYYDLVRRLLEPFSTLPPPSKPLAPLDDGLLNVYRELNRVPRGLFEALEEDTEQPEPSPLDDSAPEDIRISCAGNLNARLRAIQLAEHGGPAEQFTPEIRLESDDDAEPHLAQRTLLDQTAPGVSTTLHPSHAFSAAPAPERHASALLRLLYIHSRLNPANRSPHIASLLLPLYTVLSREIDSQDLPHIEADTFWVFEAMVGEFSELEDEEGGGVWMQRLGERLAWADDDLASNLRAKGLDPALPHYSYRWLAPLLTHTLPLTAVFAVWDALFSRPQATKTSNPKLDYLLDICAGMLIRAKGPLTRLGKPQYKSSSLWAEDDTLPPPSPLRAWELSDAFMEGMALLQTYPVDAVGGIDSVLETALELLRRREKQMNPATAVNTTLGARIRDTIWRGFTNQVTDVSPEEDGDTEDEDEDEDVDSSDEDGNETEPVQAQRNSGLTSRLASTVWKGITNQSSMEVPSSPMPPSSPSPSSASLPSPKSETSQSSALTSRLATSVWKGITNQSSMEVPPSPIPPSSPMSSGTQSPLPDTPSTTYGRSPSLPRSSIWDYAEKLKDSDTAATLAKVSTNWKVKALQAWNRTSAPGTASTPSTPAAMSSGLWGHSADDRRDSFGSTVSEQVGGTSNRGHVFRPGHTDLYSPPPRPAFFRPPRDSMFPQPRREMSESSSHAEDISPQSETGILEKTKHLQASLASLTGLQHPPPKQTPRTGPRPLLLSSSSLITAPNGTSKVVNVSSTPTPQTRQTKQWSEVMQARGHPTRSASQSSVSTTLSVSRPGDRSDYESDAAGNRTSRIVPLHRSRSPMAPNFRFAQNRPVSTSSTASSDNGPSRPSSSYATARRQADSSSEKGWGRVDLPDSPTTLPSSPPPRTPTSSALFMNGVTIENPEQQRGSVVLSPSHEPTLEPPFQGRSAARRKTPPLADVDASEASDSSAPTPFKNSRLRSKRVPARLAALRIEDDIQPNTVIEQSDHSANSLAPEPTDYDLASTPRATAFDFNGGSTVSPRPRSPRRTRKTSTEGREIRTRKISAEGRVRKTSSDNHRPTDSAAEEGDDEGYNDLLSAYESEDGP
ncbi:hypothetical protein GLOTRDRAFT_120030 [Gloeophyllum trabeum ATCC 11539]|uniref:Rab-GAP TBC domain-containing protein n=1 Tax=Gloeophyllum trabeum (strain ATCC 11539 / FP-39264 / Madison 617) TaxID=670483 RepID=S7QEF8_GLOTA|nr:uncharacterized protein GLOTRDRAFT_120030 [Gloeophyllum trabeum ATCC 11539]EPQ58196.1 hypothetical protein GLOTRDRAFT_120030 [Gloeophyllum trabeum ATCC 11539]